MSKFISSFACHIYIPIQVHIVIILYVHLSSIISCYRHRDTHKSVSYSSLLLFSSSHISFSASHCFSLSRSPSLSLFFRCLFANTKAKEKKASKQAEYTIAVYNNEGVKSKLVVHRFTHTHTHISIQVNNVIVSIIFTFIVFLNAQS